MKDCTTCKYGYEDEQLGILMCHHPKRFSEDCIDFNMREEKEEKPFKEPIDGVLYAVACGIKNNGQIELLEESNKSLEEEYKDYVENDPVYSKLVNKIAGLDIARHFYEFGLKARNIEL